MNQLTSTEYSIEQSSKLASSTEFNSKAYSFKTFVEYRVSNIECCWMLLLLLIQFSKSSQSTNKRAQIKTQTIQKMNGSGGSSSISISTRLAFRGPIPDLPCQCAHQLRIRPSKILFACSLSLHRAGRTIQIRPPPFNDFTRRSAFLTRLIQ